MAKSKQRPRDDDDEDDTQPEGYGVVDERPAKKIKAHLGHKKHLEGYEEGETDVPFEFRTKKPHKKPVVTTDDVLISRVVGFVIVLMGLGMCGGSFLVRSSPGITISLFGGCGAGITWLGLGLILFPVSLEALRAFRDHKHYDELFKVLPWPWLFWFWGCFIAFAAQFLLIRFVMR